MTMTIGKALGMVVAQKQTLLHDYYEPNHNLWPVMKLVLPLKKSYSN